MIYNKGKLSETEFNFLLEQLHATEVLQGEKLNQLKETHPYLLNKVILRPNHFVVYSLENKKLNEWLSNNFSPKQIVESLYTMDYDVGSYSVKHQDYFRKVAIVLLNNDFDGGRFLIEDEDVNLTEMGEYVILDGHKYYHEITEITRGLRRVLVMFFKNKTEII